MDHEWLGTLWSDPSQGEEGWVGDRLSGMAPFMTVDRDTWIVDDVNGAVRCQVRGDVRRPPLDLLTHTPPKLIILFKDA